MMLKEYEKTYLQFIKQKENKMAKHAKLSASGSTQWLNCAGSIKAEEDHKNELIRISHEKGELYEEELKPYAEEGTLAHEIADQCLKTQREASEFIGKTVRELSKSLSKELKTIEPDFLIEQTMTDYVQQYLDYVLSHETKDSELYTEERVDFSHIVPEGFGTLDSSILVYSERILHIFDLKFGKSPNGVVSAIENTQGLCYGSGMLNELEFLDAFDTVRIHIVQPRVKNFSCWDISVKDLKNWGEWVKPRALLALTDDAPRTGGVKQCQWCDVKGNCPAQKKFVEEIICAEFDEMNADPDNLNVNVLSPEQKRNININKGFIEKFLKDVWQESYNDLDAGKQVLDFKLVNSPANRKFKPEAEKTLVRKLGKKEAFVSKLIGLGVAEKLLGKEYVDKLTFRPDPGVVMVHESDKRPAIVKESVADQFDNFDDEDEEL